MTAGELFRMPDDGYRYELVKGELKRMTPAGFDHGAIIVNLTAPLFQHVKAHRLGVVCGAETGFTLSTNPDTVLAPDIAFVRRDRIPASGRPRSYWNGAPDLAVEVLSPSDSRAEIDEKVTQWLSAGTCAVWVVHPKTETVTVHRREEPPQTLSRSETLDGGDLIAGFRLPVAEIFAL